MKTRALLAGAALACLATPTFALVTHDAKYDLTFEPDKPGRFAVADLNADGRVDLVGVVQGAPELRVRLGTGDGQFGAPTAYALPGLGADVVVSDLDADGKLDLVATGAGAAVSFFYGTGPATFGPRTDWGAGLGTQSALVVGDLDGDGRQDVVVTDAGTTQAVVARQVFPRLFLMGGSQLGATGVVSPSLADTDHDSKLDLIALARPLTSVAVARGRGDGTFELPAYFPAPNDPRSMRTGLLNADATVDAVVACGGPDGTIGVMLGTGAAGFASASLTTLGLTIVGPLAIGDATGDGALDVVAPQNARCQVVDGDGLGGFALGATFGADPTPVDIHLVDTDGNGRLDAVTSHPGTTAIGVVRQSVSGHWGGGQIVADPTIPGRIQVADFDEDGRLDIFSRDPHAPVAWVFLNRGAGPAWEKHDLPVAAPSFNDDYFAVGDLNGDGHADLALQSGPFEIQIENGDGDAGFSGGPVLTFTSAVVGVFALDLNHDGAAELLVSLQSGDLQVFQGKTLALAQTLALPVGVAIASGELNADGNPDVVITTASPAGVYALLGNGNGSGGLQAPVLVATFIEASTHVSLADFDADGHLDLLAGGGIFPGVGGTAFGSVQLLAVPRPAEFAIAGDISGDGKPDVLVSNADASGMLALLENHGGFNFTSAVGYGLASGRAHDLALGDFDGDARLDIAAASSRVLLLSTAAGSPTDAGPASHSDALLASVRTTPHEVQIQYRIETPGANVRLNAFDAGGRLVRSIDAGWRAPGTWTARWDRNDARGHAVVRGVYFMSLQAGTRHAARRVVLLNR